VLIIRAYNSRPRDVTVDEQFSKFWTSGPDGRPVLTKEGIRKAIDVDSAPWIDPLLNALVPDHVDSVLFDDFLLFLETGQAPPVPLSKEEQGKTPPFPAGDPPFGAPAKSQTESAAATAAPKNLDAKIEYMDKGQDRPVDNPSIDEPVEVVAGSDAVEKVVPDCMYSDVYESLGFAPGGSSDMVLGPSAVTTMVPYDRRRRLLQIKATGRSLWRKREVVVHQRTVHYTTVDEDGFVQELVEIEKNQTEILHCEAKDTGEFAHRETTNFEAIETFNDDLVNERRGSEEYVHLKSKFDEYEKWDSNMPAKNHGHADARGGAPHSPDEPAAHATPEHRRSATEGTTIVSLEHLLPYLEYMGGRVPIFAVTAEEVFLTETGPRTLLALKGTFLSSEAAFAFAETLPTELTLRLLEDVAILDPETPLQANLLNGLDHTCMFQVPDVLAQIDKLLELQIKARTEQQEERMRSPKASREARSPVAARMSPIPHSELNSPAGSAHGDGPKSREDGRCFFGVGDGDSVVGEHPPSQNGNGRYSHIFEGSGAEEPGCVRIHLSDVGPDGVVKLPELGGSSQSCADGENPDEHAAQEARASQFSDDLD